MYIRRKLLWWLVPVFMGLFLAGMAMGALSNKLAEQAAAKRAAEEVKQSLEERQAFLKWLNRWTGDEETPFDVYVKDMMLSGAFQGANFRLSGKVQGHQLHMKRENGDIAITIDGEEREAYLMPFALYTPYDHLRLVQGRLSSLNPVPLKGEDRPGLAGYEFTLPGTEVQELLSLWLGPNFPTDDVISEMNSQMAVTYQFWLDKQLEHLRYLVVTLRMDTASGTKQDQLVFRL